MTPDERRSLIKDIVDVLEVRVIKPMEKRIEVRFAALEETDAKLKAKDAQLSGQHRAVTREIIPRLQSESKVEQDGKDAGIAEAINRFALVLNETNERAARAEASSAETREIAARIEERGLVKITDARGTTSIKPTMLVNTEATLRTEGKTDAIQVAANRSDAQSLVAAKWAKRGPLITSIVSIAVAIGLGIYQAVQAAAAAAGH